MHKRFNNVLPLRGSVLGGLVAASLAIAVPAPMWTPAAMAQTASSTVSGEVLDSNGDPLIGATVLVKGSKDGVATDFDGRFTLNVPKGATLQVSYIGFKPKDVKVTGSEMTITLEDDSSVLDEVVVVGYGTQKKATMTGSVAVVGAEALSNKGNLSSPVQALQGQVPGVIITRNSTAPGDESWNMSLRGAVSKNSAAPLVIIDGVEYESVNDLRLINLSLIHI